MNIHLAFSDIMNTLFIHKVGFDVAEPGYRLDTRYHKIFEILYCYDGQVDEWLNETKLSFRSGDWLFINSGVRHRTFNDTDRSFSFFAIHFDIDDPDIRKILKSLHLRQNYIPRSIAAQSSLPLYIQSIESNIHAAVISNSHEYPAEELLSMTPLQKLSFQANILLIIQEMIKLQQEMALKDAASTSRTVSSMELDTANQIALLLEQSLHEAIPIQSIARMVNLSRSQCTRVFTNVYGIPPQKYRSLFVIKKSKQLLLQTNLSIEEISKQLGFSSTQYFSKQFRRWTGFAPSKFRPRHTLQ